MAERLTTVVDTTVVKFAWGGDPREPARVQPQGDHGNGQGGGDTDVSVDELMDRPERLELDGRRVMKVYRGSRRNEPYYEFECLLSEEDLAPSGSEGLAQAVVVRMYALLGTPVPPDERKEADGDAATISAIDKLAAEPSRGRARKRKHRRNPNALGASDNRGRAREPRRDEGTRCSLSTSSGAGPRVTDPDCSQQRGVQPRIHARPQKQRESADGGNQPLPKFRKRQGTAERPRSKNGEVGIDRGQSGAKCTRSAYPRRRGCTDGRWKRRSGQPPR